VVLPRVPEVLRCGHLVAFGVDGGIPFVRVEVMLGWQGELRNELLC